MIKNLFVKSINTFKQYDVMFKLLLFYVSSLPLMMTPNLPLLAQRIQLSEVLFIFLFFFWLKDLLKNRKLPQDTGLDRPFLFFVVFCLISFFHSTNLFLSAIELSGLIYLFIMFVLVTDIVNSKKKLNAIIKIWIGTLSVVLVLGFIGWIICLATRKANIFCWANFGIFPYHESFPFLTVYRTISTFRHPAGLANYLTVSLGFILSDFLITENKKYKTFLKIMIFLICFVMITTTSRNLLGFMVCLFLIYNHFSGIKTLRFKTLRFVSISIIIIIFFVIIVFFSTFHLLSYKFKDSFKDNHKELAVNVNYAYDIRLAYKIAAVEMLKRHPFSGVGLAMYPSYSASLNRENYFGKNFIPVNDPIHSVRYSNIMRVGDPHCDILRYFAETGILGGTAFIIFIVIFLRIVWTNLKGKNKNDQYFRVRLFCFFAAFVGVLLDSFDFDIFKLRHIWFLMALTLALIMMHKNKQLDT